MRLVASDTFAPINHPLVQMCTFESGTLYKICIIENSVNSLCRALGVTQFVLNRRCLSRRPQPAPFGFVDLDKAFDRVPREVKAGQCVSSELKNG